MGAGSAASCVQRAENVTRFARTPDMNAQIGMDINERARRALTRVPPSMKVTDEMVADVADALRGAVRAAYQNAAVIATSRTHAGGALEESRARRSEAEELAQMYEKLANESR
jgi:hypothetical protein